MNYQLEQTGEQVQEILNQAPTTEQNLQNEITRSTGKDEELEIAIGNEKNRAEGVEAELQTSIGNEKARAEGAEAELQTAIGNEKSRAEGVEGGLRTDVDGIEAKIPTGASEQNKLATESFVNSSVATNTADFKGTFQSLEALQTEVHDANANDYAFVISTDAAGNTVYSRYKYVTGTGWVFEYALNNSSFTAAQWAAIQSGITALLVAKLAGLPTVAELTQQLNTIIASVSDEQTRAEGAEAVLRQSITDNATAIANEKTRAQNAEGTLSTNIVNEENRAKAAEVVLQQNIDAEAILRDNADDALQAQIDDIDAKIPEQASASNQLADKAFVNSSIATNTADFKGTYNSLQELQQVSANNNDYGFVVSVDSDGNTVYNRYKYVDGTGWVFEYALNNSSFTSAQWAAIQSGITAALVAKLNGLPDITALNAMFAAITNLIPSAATSENKLVDYAQMVAALATKQNTLTFDNVPTEDSNNPVKSGGVYSAIATVTAAIVGLQSSKQDVLTFDQYPTAGSDNPVKSKGIYEKLAEKQATLVPGTNLDTTPTANSNNPVTSGGVKAALDLKQNTLTFDNAPTVNSNNPVKSGGIKSAIDSEATRAQGVENSLGVRVSTNETDIANLQQLYNNLQQSKPVPVTALPSSGQQQGVIYRLAGTTSYSDYMWNGSTWVLMATYNNAIDPRPKKASQNLVTSGGVFDNMGALDVSELNATENPHTLAQYADLSSALAAIPTDYQKGGMSIKFVQSSDNKYVQWRLMAQNFTTDVTQWQGVDDVPTAGSDNLVKSSGVLSTINTARPLEYNGTISGAVWMFNDLTLVQGRTYYIRHISGDGNDIRLNIGNSLGAYLKTNRWIEYVAPESGHPYIFMGTPVNMPTIEVASNDNLLVKNTIIPNESEIDNLEEDVSKAEIVKVVAERTENAWIFNGLSLVANKQYYMRLVSGDGNGKKLAFIGGGSQLTNNALEIGKWINMVSPVSGTPYIYTGGTFGIAPTVEITTDTNLLVKDTIVQIESEIQKIKDGVVYNVINVSRDGTSATGRTIHFSGLSAIADAMNSITDASETNRYTIHVEGEFHFTDPLTLTMLAGGEYSAIAMKPWVDIEGDGADKSIIFVDLPANATFHDGKHYNDYQPVYFYGVGGAIRNMMIAGKNCRYSFHIENGGESGFGKEINIENCDVFCFGAPDYVEGGSMDCFGTGISDGQTWNIKNTRIINYNGNAFAMHTPLVKFKNVAKVNFENCVFRGDIKLHNYQVENNTFVNMIGCSFAKGVVPYIAYSYYNNKPVAVHGDYTTIITNANTLNAFYNCAYLWGSTKKGCVLKVVSNSTGTSSKVRFGQSSTAFSVIIGDPSETGKLKTKYSWNTQYGFVFRDGGVGLSGQAFGTIDIDPNSSSGNTLGTLLGDCTSNNKTLVVNVDGNNYTITFNEDYTSKDNDYVIGKINDIIGSVATADVFCPALLYYPTINGMCEVTSVDSGAILKGMGVVFTPEGMKKAKNSDGYIDGICLDDTSVGQIGRVIINGYIANYASRASMGRWFTTLDNIDTDILTLNGQTLGVDPDNDGKFKLGVSPATLRVKCGVIELL